MNTPAWIFLCFVCLMACVALYASGAHIRCVRCGRRCGGRIAGGTVDRPQCVRCIKEDDDIGTALFGGLTPSDFDQAAPRREQNDG